mmetsp:Transcript_17235/g.21492  ORF Transcript_17235/g.21492 Transcript_17235/m.21492 type:complete len:206 (-) Transcript_17235:100-717(-)|eukprot:CAMPEP_0172489500 /NCGR_PEP_ID=MMETSP1066-20121228/19534_1 /TAXON_ID=671091 /ORGANISM="Coscinodiscus wailesii, Strain CCMP2513" /LENGTH=205 /DNA_ID=CAMNT_0013257413 /DNA_START=115 /DNA_END=732 /DNA_ORIENTATION=+
MSPNAESNDTPLEPPTPPLFLSNLSPLHTTNNTGDSGHQPQDHDEGDVEISEISITDRQIIAIPSPSSSDDDDDDDDDVTIIGDDNSTFHRYDFLNLTATAVTPLTNGNDDNTPNNNQDDNNDDAVDAGRRLVVQRELERVQRANFCHFMLLCLVPTSLLLIVVFTVMSDGHDCVSSSLTKCFAEPRTFVNAFTSRCICDAVLVD